MLDPALDHNAVYRLLEKIHRRDRRRRVRLVTVYAVGAIALSAAYARYVFALSWTEATLTAAAFALVLLVVLANLFFFGGIKGYESVLAILPWAGDLYLTGLPAGEVAAAVRANTAAHYPVRRLRGALIGAAFCLTAAAFALDWMLASFLIDWVLLVGMWAAVHLAVSARRIDAVALPGTVLWTRGVRMGLERRLAERAMTAPFLSGLRLALFFLAVFGLMLGAVYYFSFLGLVVNTLYPRGSEFIDRAIFLGVVAAFGAAGGCLSGFLCRALAERLADRYLRSLTRHLEKIVELKARDEDGGTDQA